MNFIDLCQVFSGFWKDIKQQNCLKTLVLEFENTCLGKNCECFVGDKGLGLIGLNSLKMNLKYNDLGYRVEDIANLGKLLK